MKNKDRRNPRTCILIHTYAHTCSSFAYACFMHAYTYMGMHMHVRVPETMKGKFYALKFGFWTNFTSSWSHSKPPFLNYKKPYIVAFQKTQKILRENIRFTRNSESKMEFFTKHPQVNIFLIETFFGLNLQV